MDEQRFQEYLNLIQELLSCPSGQEPEILQANQNLIDEELVAVMELVADDMAKSGNQNAERLRNFAAQLAESIGESRWKQLNQRVEELYGQGNYDRAVIFAKQALDLAQRLWGEEHPDVATSLNNLAALYESQGRYSEAEPLYLQALEVRKRLLGEEHPHVASSLNNLAALYESQGCYSEAEPLLVQALELHKRLLGEEHPNVATSLNNLAALYDSQGRYSEAEPLYLQALELRKRLLGEEHPNVATSLNNLALLYKSQGRYSEAELLCLQALELDKRLLGEEHPLVASSLNNLALLYNSQGRYSEAGLLLVQALELHKRLLGEEHPNVATSLNNLAALYDSQGRYSEAEPLYLQALELCKRLLGEEHPDVATSLNNLAALYESQGRYSEAEPLHLQALELCKRLLGEEHPYVASSLNNLALLYEYQGRYSEAEPLHLQALELCKRLLGEEHPYVASSLNNLALLYEYQGRYSEAEPLHLQALELRKRLLGEEHPDVAMSLHNLAGLYESQGRYSEAEPLFVQALELRKCLLGEEHPDVASSLNNLAILLAATDRPHEALELMRQATEVEDKIIRREFAASCERDRLTHLQTIRTTFEALLSLVLNYLPKSPKAVQTALDLVLRRKSLTAAVLAAQNQALYSGRYPHLSEQFQQLRSLSDKIIHLTYAIPTPEQLIATKQNLAKLQVEYDNLQKKLASQVPEIQLQEQLVNCRTVAAALPKDSTLVDFVRFDVFNFTAPEEKRWQSARYLAFILPAQQPDRAQMIDLGEADKIDSLIQAFRESASRGNPPVVAPQLDMYSDDAELPIPQYNPVAGIELREAVFDKIRPVLNKHDHLLLSPDGNLNLVPFQILPLDETGKGMLMDDYTISYLSSGRDVLRSQVETKRLASAPLVIADPDFDFSETSTMVSAITRSDRPQSDKMLSANQVRSLNTLAGCFHRAPGTGILGESVANMLGIQPYLGDKALESLLTNNKCPRILLIATHGYFSEEKKQQQKLSSQNPEDRLSAKVENPMLRSGLAFAGANTWLSGGTLPPKAGKGLLFAQDVAALDLWANELTVLCACNTAMGDIKLGEGVFGLRRAFAVAGAKTLVMSLWSVPTHATVLLMEHFFTKYNAGFGGVAALQSAQNYLRTVTAKELRQSFLGLEVLKELEGIKELNQQASPAYKEDDTPLNHPYYWGAWVCQQ